MRALRLLALAAALVVPAAAAHAQVGVYVGPSVRYAAPYGARIHADHRFYGRPFVNGPWIAPPVYGYGYGWHGGAYHRGWAHDGRYGYGRRW
jgi:hypothetical protein